MSSLNGVSHDKKLNKKHQGILYAQEAIWKIRHAASTELLEKVTVLDSSCQVYDFPEGHLNCQVIRGQVLVFLGQGEAALDLGEQVLKDFELMHIKNKSFYSPFELRAYNFLGAACLMNGNYAQGLVYWQQGLLMSDNMEADPIIVNLLHNLAELYRGILNDVERAMEFYTKALEWSVKFELPIQYMLEAGKALCMAMLGNDQDALSTLESLISKKEDCEDKLPPYLKLLYYQFVAHAYLECAAFENALHYARVGLDILGNHGDTFRRLNYLLIIARAYAGLNLPFKAIETSSEFLAIEASAKHNGLLMFIYKVMASSFGALEAWKDQAHYANLCVQVTEKEIKERLDRQAGIVAAQTKQHLLQKDLEIHQLRNVALKEKSEALEKTALELTNALNELMNTQLKLVESEKLAALGRVVSGVAHEINTPLGVACSSLSYLESICDKRRSKKCPDDDTSEIYEAFSLLNSSLNKVNRIVTRFRDISAQHAIYERSEFRIVDLLDLSHHMAITLSRKYMQATDSTPQIEIQILPLDLPKDFEIESYPSAWQNIVVELLTNAIIHNMNLPYPLLINVTFEVSINQRDQNTNTLRLIVEDNGNGIPLDFQPKIFEPFSRVHPHLDHMGLGLHSLHNLVVELLKGEIWLDVSRPGCTRILVETTYLEGSIFR